MLSALRSRLTRDSPRLYGSPGGPRRTRDRPDAEGRQQRLQRARRRGRALEGLRKGAVAAGAPALRGEHRRPRRRHRRRHPTARHHECRRPTVLRAQREVVAVDRSGLRGPVSGAVVRLVRLLGRRCRWILRRCRHHHRRRGTSSSAATTRGSSAATACSDSVLHGVFRARRTGEPSGTASRCR